ncbi:MAG: alpha/beta hydrolase [Actinobacteria bacterium]|nr:alpha/beta hydrolase [Actinomycetota bacterium]
MGPVIPSDLALASRLILTRMDELGLLGRATETVAEVRALAAAEAALIGPPAAVGGVEEVVILGRGPGREIPIRVYRPQGRAERAILWLHGGGWVTGGLEAADVGCRALCRDTSALVASVGYRLAPEHPFPAGLDDCFAALRWFDDRRASGAEALPLIVAGDSAGGNLAAALCLLARESGGPAIHHQVLLYPVTNPDFETDSYRDFADGYGLGRELMRWFWRHYVGTVEDRVDHRAAVLRAPDLRDLPPATIVIAGRDVLRDEAEAYAGRLRDAAVPVDVLRYPGQIHGFWHYSAVSDIQRSVNREIGRTLLAGDGGPGRPISCRA